MGNKKKHRTKENLNKSTSEYIDLIKTRKTKTRWIKPIFLKFLFKMKKKEEEKINIKNENLINE